MHSGCRRLLLQMVETCTVRSLTRQRVEEFLDVWMRKHGKIRMVVADFGSQFTSPAFIT